MSPYRAAAVSPRRLRGRGSCLARLLAPQTITLRLAPRQGGSRQPTDADRTLAADEAAAGLATRGAAQSAWAETTAKTLTRSWALRAESRRWRTC